VKHTPVLYEEALKHLSIKQDGIYVDCTLGGGSHAAGVLSRLKTGHLYAFDQDDFAIDKAKEELKKTGNRYTILKENFRNLASALQEQGVKEVDGVLYDLGVSSFHFDDAKRGFSYRHDAPLDMRMDTERSLTAKDVVNTYSADELKRIFFSYGEERFAPQIARNIVKSRQKQPIETTFELVDLIKASMPQKALSKKGHPAKRVFQALRIEVNDELSALKESLEAAIDLLKPDGRIVVISFHSLEDKIVKDLFKEASSVDHPDFLVTMPEERAPFERVQKKVIRPSDAEMAENPRAKSAKMRVLRRRKEND